MDTKTYFKVLSELDELVGKKYAYSNCTIATVLAMGKRLSDDWLRRHLLTCVEDDFYSYAEAIALRNIYLAYLN